MNEGMRVLHGHKFNSDWLIPVFSQTQTEKMCNLVPLPYSVFFPLSAHWKATE